MIILFDLENKREVVVIVYAQRRRRGVGLFSVKIRDPRTRVRGVDVM